MPSSRSTMIERSRAITSKRLFSCGFTLAIYRWCYLCTTPHGGSTFMCVSLPQSSLCTHPAQSSDIITIRITMRTVLEKQRDENDNVLRLEKPLRRWYGKGPAVSVLTLQIPNQLTVLPLHPAPRQVQHGVCHAGRVSPPAVPRSLLLRTVQATSGHGQLVYDCRGHCDVSCPCLCGRAGGCDDSLGRSPGHWRFYPCDAREEFDISCWHNTPDASRFLPIVSADRQLPNMHMVGLSKPETYSRYTTYIVGRH